MDRRHVVLGGLAAGAGLLAGLPARADTKEVVIGAIWPFSGASAVVGVDVKSSLETALDIVNTVHDLDLPTARNAGLAGLGGAKLRIVYADHQGDPMKGRAEAERLIAQEKVSAILGAYHSAVSATVSETAERYSVPYVCADSSSPSLHRRGLKFFFRPSAHDEFFYKAMFDFMDALKAKGETIESLGLFHEETIFGTDSANVQLKLAHERGYQVVADVKYRANSPSLTAEVQQLKASNASVLMPTTYTNDGILLIKTMADLGYRPKAIVAQAAGFAQQSLFDAVGDKLDGLISRDSFSLDMAARRPMIGVVNALYKARSGKDMNDNTSRQFMSLIILADAIDRARSTEGPAIRDALAATNIPGERTIMPWKEVKFSAEGQNESADPVLLQYLGGKFVTIFPEAVAVAKAKWPMNG